MRLYPHPYEISYHKRQEHAVVQFRLCFTVVQNITEVASDILIAFYLCPILLTYVAGTQQYIQHVRWVNDDYLICWIWAFRSIVFFIRIDDIDGLFDWKIFMTKIYIHINQIKNIIDRLFRYNIIFCSV